MRFHLPCSGRWPGLLTLPLLLLLSPLPPLGLATAHAESVNVIKPWVRVLSAPKTGAKTVGLAYGNDNYDVMEDQGDWVKIRARGKVTGWLSKDDVYAVIDPIAAKSLAFALELKALQLKSGGKDDEARAKLFEVVMRFPGTFQSYEATRHLLTWHDVGKLPEPKDRKIGNKDKLEAERLASLMMVREGAVLIGAKHYPQAVAMFEEARKRGRVNRSAMDGIRVALQSDHTDAVKAGDKPRAEMTLMALRAYFPTAEHPESFKLETFAKPPVRKPSMSPLVPPPPAIQEDDQLPPSTHEFERKELELAPLPDNNLPAPPSAAPPAPEAGAPEKQAPAKKAPAGPPPANKAPEAKQPEAKQNAKPEAKAPNAEPAPPKEARPEEPNKKTDAPKAPPGTSPKKKEADERLKAKKPAQQAALPRVSPAIPPLATPAAAPAAPRDTPPGFPAQAEAQATLHETPTQGTAMQGLWPVPQEPQPEANPPAVSADKLPGFALAPAKKRRHAAPAATTGSSDPSLWAVAVQNHAPPPPPALTDLNERPAMLSPGTAR